MSHKFNPEKAEKLIAPERYQEIKPEILLQKLGIGPGSTILDLGCGNGFFTFPAAVGMGENGMVIAADVSEEMLLMLNRRGPPDNVQVLHVEEVNLDVEDESVDGAVAISLYHELKAPLENLNEIKRVLKPEGKLMFMDWDPQAERVRGPALDHRVSREQVINDLEVLGFTIDIQENYRDDIWLLIAHKSA